MLISAPPSAEAKPRIANGSPCTHINDVCPVGGADLCAKMVKLLGEDVAVRARIQHQARNAPSSSPRKPQSNAIFEAI